MKINSIKHWKTRYPLRKYSKNPILIPNENHSWEAFQTFNPGAILLDDKIHLIYRAIGNDGISRFGYAMTEDGFHIAERSPKPIYERKHIEYKLFYSPSGGGFGGSEDPRIVRVGKEDKIYMTYTAFGELRVGLTSISVENFINKKWEWEPEKLISPPGEVHKNFVIFPEKIKGKYAIITRISPKITIEYRDSLHFSENDYIGSKYIGVSNPNGWEAVIKSIGPPPIKTKEGWLVFYHGLDKKEPWKYKIGAMILDRKNPEEIIYRAKRPIIEPENSHEINGFKPWIVYSCGAVVKDGILFVYYGCADSYTCVAYGNLNEFLDALKEKKKPPLKKRMLVKKRKSKKVGLDDS